MIFSLLNSIPGVVAQGLIWGIMGLGVYITFKVLDIADLTVDGTLSLGGSVCVMMIRGGFNPVLATACGFLSGLIAGLVTGVFNTKCKIPMILSGILTQLALYSVNLRIMQGKANQPVSVDKYNLLLSQRNIGEFILRNPVFKLLIIAILTIIILYWFFGTEYGSSIRATGSNIIMSKAQGINTDINIIFGLILSNGLVAFAGALLSQYQGATDVNMGRGAIVIGLAAIIIGGKLMGDHIRNFGLKMLSVIFGAIIYYFVLQIVLNLGLNTNDLKLFTALFVAIFLTMGNIGKVIKKGGK